MTFTAIVRPGDITHLAAYRVDHAYVQLQLGSSHVYINGRLGATGHAEQIDDIRRVLTGLLTALDAIDPANGDQTEYYVPWSLDGAHDPQCATAYGGACERLAGCPGDPEADEDQEHGHDQVRHHLTPPELRAHLLAAEGDGGHGQASDDLNDLAEAGLDDEATHNLSHATRDPLDLADPAALGHTRIDHELTTPAPDTSRGGPEGDDLDDDYCADCGHNHTGPCADDCGDGEHGPCPDPDCTDPRCREGRWS